MWRPHRYCMPFLLLIIAALPLRVHADGAPSALNSPLGSWKTIDDKTGQPKAVVEVREANGEFEGYIVQLFNPPVPHPECIKCTGALKNKPVNGMRILWGMRQEGSEWTGGHILDPENGNVYRCTFTLDNGGKELRIRGYVGFSVFGRTEKWLRVEHPKE